MTPGWPSRRRVSLRTRLLLGLGLVVALVAGLLVGANQIVTRSSQDLESLLMQQVRPLAVANRLQSRLTRLHQLEVEVPRLEDYFAVTSHLERIRALAEDVEAELLPLGERLAGESPIRSQRLLENWRAYREDLGRMSDAAMRMEMERARQVSSLDASGRFERISRIFDALAAEKEQAATVQYERAVERGRARRHWLVVASALGVLSLSGGLLVFSRRLSRRVHGLRDVAVAVAKGEVTRPPETAGSDELADLGHAFNTMQQRIAEREHALLRAQDRLEERVAARTRELRDSNDRLTHEIEVRREAQDRLRLLSTAVEQSSIGVLIVDLDCRIAYVNEALLAATGDRREDWIGGQLDPDTVGAEGGGGLRAIREHMLHGHDWSVERVRERADGSRFWEFLRITPIRDDAGRVTHALAMREDITERKEQEEKILFQARYDALTELPNRVLTMDRLAHAISVARREDHWVALLFVDLDGFKQINDTLGHEVGDLLLTEAAGRLSGAVRGEDTVGRQGGDEFIVIMSGIRSTTDAETVAEKVVTAFSSPFPIDGRDLRISCSIGVALYPGDGTDAAMLLRHADAAVYQAKEAGRGTYRFYGTGAQSDSVLTIDIESRLRGALGRDEFHLVYQPVIDSATGRPVRAEALLRWEYGGSTTMSPERFIGVADQTGLIVPIGNWVLREACETVSRWRADGLSEIGIAVNLSPRQCRPELVETTRRILGETGLPPEALQFEINEAVLMRHEPDVQETLEAIDRLGVQLALDDFGSGISSLSHLQRLPFHTLKIDTTFVHGVADNPDDRALVAAAVSMGRRLGMEMVAEGVEREEDRRFLSETGCDRMQGRGLGEPVIGQRFFACWCRPGGVHRVGAE